MAHFCWLSAYTVWVPTRRFGSRHPGALDQSAANARSFTPQMRKRPRAPAKDHIFGVLMGGAGAAIGAWIGRNETLYSAAAH